MRRISSGVLALITSAALAQKPSAPTRNPQDQAAAQPPIHRSPRAETANTDIYYKLAPDAFPQEGVPKAKSRVRSRWPAKHIPARSTHTGSMFLRNTIRGFLQA